MRRAIWFALFFVSMWALVWIYGFWQGLEGQVLFRASLKLDAETLQQLDSFASENEVHLAAYALREGSVKAGQRPAEELLLHECLVFDVDGLGIVPRDGRVLTKEQIERGSAVALLSEGAAHRLFGNPESHGGAARINGQDCEIIGVYRDRAPLGFLTNRADMSAIIPAPLVGSTRRVILWIYTDGDAALLFGKAQRWMNEMVVSEELGAVHGVDLDAWRSLGQQGIRFWALACLLIACFRLWRKLRLNRQRFYRRFRELAETHYGAQTILRSAGPWGLYFMPSLLILAAALMGFGFVASNLAINPQWVPTLFLDPEEWLTTLKNGFQALNRAETIPAFGYLAGERLDWLGGLLGPASAIALWIGTKNRAE